MEIKMKIRTCLIKTNCCMNPALHNFKAPVVRHTRDACVSCRQQLQLNGFHHFGSAGEACPNMPPLCRIPPPPPPQPPARCGAARLNMSNVRRVYSARRRGSWDGQPLQNTAGHAQTLLHTHQDMTQPLSCYFISSGHNRWVRCGVTSSQRLLRRHAAARTWPCTPRCAAI